MNGRSQAFPLQISLLTPVEVFAGISAEGLNKEFKFDLTIFLLLSKVTLIILSLKKYPAYYQFSFSSICTVQPAS